MSQDKPITDLTDDELVNELKMIGNKPFLHVKEDEITRYQLLKAEAHTRKDSMGKVLLRIYGPQGPDQK